MTKEAYVTIPGANFWDDNWCNMRNQSTNLNEKFKRVNVRRNADTKATKVAILTMEEEVNWQFHGDDILLNHCTKGKY